MTTEDVDSSNAEAERKASLFAQEYVAKLDGAVRGVFDDDLRRIVHNAYATAYLHGRMDVIEEHMAQFQLLSDRITELEFQLGDVS